jgi:hypothetical protein
MTIETEIQSLLDAPRLDVERLAESFEKAGHAERVAVTESIDARGQALLWDAAEGRRVTISEMVPRSLGPLVPVTFWGKNSLPRFSRFQKRFCRPSAEIDRDELWGFNYQPTRWLRPLTGPGYFVAVDSRDPLGSIEIDYRKIPSARPEGWPEIRDNDYRLSRFIYRGLVDYLRRVSEHLLIGRATRGGKALPNYFLLCREDPAS